jgi:hypothetical protein
MVIPPSKRIEAILAGKVRMEDEDEAIQSACRLPIYQGAEAILSLPTKEKRRAALAKIPESVRPYVEKEAIRLHKLRTPQ